MPGTKPDTSGNLSARSRCPNNANCTSRPGTGGGVLQPGTADAGDQQPGTGTLSCNCRPTEMAHSQYGGELRVLGTPTSLCPCGSPAAPPSFPPVLTYFPSVLKAF
jgi:hypothetical protein